MTKFILKSLAIVLVFVGIALGIMKLYTKEEGVKRSQGNELNISAYLDAYDEEVQRDEIAQPKALKIAERGNPEVELVLKEDGSEELREAVYEMADIMSQIIGNKVQVSYSNVVEKTGIYIGNYSHIDRSSVEEDGYIIESQEGNLFIQGNTDMGTINGIYSFLEDYLACMFVRTDYTYIPSFPTIYLDEIHEVNNPDFAVRNMFQSEVYATDWYKKIKSNGSNDQSWGNAQHTVFEFVPPESYFEEHPEYYSLRWFRRVPEQLCLSNEEILPIIEKKMETLIQENPTAIYWDFSIMDNLKYCQCKECKKLYKKYENKSGSILVVLNHLAKRWPDKVFSTLAYTYNEKAPNNMKLEKNILIRIAPIKSGQLYSHRYAGNKKAKNTSQIFESWSNVAHQIQVWDYVVNFEHLLLPYPNFEVQRDNLIFYKKNNVKNMFHQGMYVKSKKNGMNMELSQLRSYIMAKQLWDIDTDINIALAKYIKVTYGEAAPYVAKYLDDMHKNLNMYDKDLDLYDKPSDHAKGYLAPQYIETYMETINNGMNVLTESGEHLDRIEVIKVNVLYANMYERSFDFKGKANAFEEFKYLTEKHHIESVNEWQNEPMEYFYNEYRSYLFKQKMIFVLMSMTLVGLAGLIAYSIIRRFR